MSVKLYAMTCDRITELWRWGWRVSPDGYKAIVEYARMAWKATQALVEKIQLEQPLPYEDTSVEIAVLAMGTLLLFLLDLPALAIAAGCEFRRWADAAIYGGQWWGERFWEVYWAPGGLTNPDRSAMPCMRHQI